MKVRPIFHALGIHSLSLLLVSMFARPLVAEPFEQHMALLCRAIYENNESRVAALLKTPYVLLDEKFSDNLGDCRGDTPLALALKKGSDAIVTRLLEAGAEQLESYDYVGRPGHPLTWMQRAVYTMLWHSHSSNRIWSRFQLFIRYWEKDRGLSFIESKIEEPNAKGEDLLTWLCTEQPNPSYNATHWQTLQDKEARGMQGGRELVQYAAARLGTPEKTLPNLCPGWTPP